MRPVAYKTPPRCSLACPAISDRFAPAPCLAFRLAGSCQWQHMMLSLTQGEPDGHQQTEIKIRKVRTQILSYGKTPRQEQRPGSTEAHRGDQCHCFKNGTIEITCVFVVQTVGGAKDAVRTEGHNDRRDHEGDGLAATFGPRLPCRRGQEDACPQST